MKREIYKRNGYSHFETLFEVPDGEPRPFVLADRVCRSGLPQQRRAVFRQRREVAGQPQQIGDRLAECRRQMAFELCQLGLIGQQTGKRPFVQPVGRRPGDQIGLTGQAGGVAQVFQLGADGGAVGRQPPPRRFGKSAQALRRLARERQVFPRIETQGGKRRRFRAIAQAFRRFGIGGGAEAFPDKRRLEPEVGTERSRRRVAQAFQQRQRVEALPCDPVAGEPVGERFKLPVGRIEQAHPRIARHRTAPWRGRSGPTHRRAAAPRRQRRHRRWRGYRPALRTRA